MNLSRIGIKSWNNYLNNCSYQTPFHNAFFIDLSVREFGGEYNLYIATEDDNSWLIPIFKKPSDIEKGTCSTSFIGYGGPLSLHKIKDPNDEYKQYLKIIRKIEEENNLSCQGGVLFPMKDWRNATELQLSDTLIANLRDNYDDTFNDVLTGNARTAVRKAEKNQVTVKKVTSEAKELEIASDLIAKTQTHVGASYTTPLSFITKIQQDHNIDSEVMIAIAEERIIGAIMLLKNKYQSFHWLHGWDRDYAKLCGNQLLIWNMICDCIDYGSIAINLGASHKEEQKKAKMRWGAQNVSIVQLTLNAG